jgi:hypothetical protein
MDGVTEREAPNMFSTAFTARTLVAHLAAPSASLDLARLTETFRGLNATERAAVRTEAAKLRKPVNGVYTASARDLDTASTIEAALAGARF